MSLRIAIACDHGGIELANHLLQKLVGDGYEVVNLGVDSSDAVEYPEKAHALANAVLSGQADRGVLICGTGIGVSIAANRHSGIRAALCTDPVCARLSREHNNANVLCLGGRIVGPVLAESILSTFLETSFEGGRHERRLKKIEPQ